MEVINNNSYAASIESYPASVFVSYDGGSNRAVISNGIYGEIYSLAYDGACIFASGNDGIFRSSNGDGLLELCETGMYYVNSIAASGGEVCAGSYRRISESLKFGKRVLLAPAVPVHLHTQTVRKDSG